MRGQFWCKFQFGVGQNLWVMGGYGILGVWVKRGSTVFLFFFAVNQFRIPFFVLRYLYFTIILR